MNKCFLEALLNDSLTKVISGDFLQINDTFCYTRNSHLYVNFNNNPVVALGLVGATFYRGSSYILNASRYYAVENEGSGFNFESDSGDLKYFKIEDSSVYSREFGDIIRLMLLSEYLENNIVVALDYGSIYVTKENGEIEVGDVFSKEEVINSIKEDIKSIVLEEGKSLILPGSYPSNLDVDKILRDEDYTIISRFRDNTIEDLNRFYGDKLVFKVSKCCYYVNGKGLIFLTPTQCIVTEMLRKMTFLFNKLIATKSAQNWFYKNKEYLLSLIKNEKVKNIVNKIINDEDLVDDTYNFILDIFRVENKKVNKYYNEYLDNINQSRLIDYCSRHDASLSIKELKAHIKNINMSINEELKDTYAGIRNLNLQLELLEENLKKSGANPEVVKAIKYLEKMKSSKVVRDYFIDNKENALVIHTNWLRQKFVELNNLNKRYLNDYIYHTYCEILRVENPDQYIKTRNDCIASMLNYEDKYSFVVMPATIVIKFSSILQHGIGYENFIDYNAYTFLKNGHSKYFTTEVSYKNICLNKGCLGSSENVFNECSSEYNLTKYISLLLQYLQTFIPLDTAGDFSLIHNPIIDNDGKVISFIDDLTAVGKYINENSSPESSPFVDKEEENNGN